MFILLEADRKKLNLISETNRRRMGWRLHGRWVAGICRWEAAHYVRTDANRKCIVGNEWIILRKSWLKYYQCFAPVSIQVCWGTLQSWETFFSAFQNYWKEYATLKGRTSEKKLKRTIRCGITTMRFFLPCSLISMEKVNLWIIPPPTGSSFHLYSHIKSYISTSPDKRAKKIHQNDLNDSSRLLLTHEKMPH